MEHQKLILKAFRGNLVKDCPVDGVLAHNLWVLARLPAAERIQEEPPFEELAQAA